MKRVSELLLGVAVDGDQVKLSAIEGEDIEVLSVGFFDSDLGPSAAVLGKLHDEKVWFVTASAILVEGFDKLREELPFIARFVQKLSANDRRYWTME